MADQAYDRLLREMQRTASSFPSDEHLTDDVVDIMRKVHRKYYAPEYNWDENSPQPIGSRQTISAPYQHACALQLLKGVLKPGNYSLDVGAGSGYLTAAMGHMVKVDDPNNPGIAIGVELYEDLTTKARENVARDPESQHFLTTGKFEIFQGNATKESVHNAIQEKLREAGGVEPLQFHAIHVGALASPEKATEMAARLLRPGGKMVCPIGYNTIGTFAVLRKEEDGKLRKTDYHGVCYVPLQE